jgi:hypothetical protein
VSDQVPEQLIAGDTWMWTRSLPLYPAPTWILTYYLIKAGDRIEITADASGQGHEISVAAATTATKKAGRYRWTARVSDGTQKVTVEQGWVDVLPDPAKGISDPRTWAARTLAAVEGFLEGNATTAQQSMTVNGRSLSRWSIEDLMKLRDRLRQEVKGEENRGQGGRGRVIKARFTRA